MVTFQSVAKSLTHEAFRCVETGVVYSIESLGRSFIVRNSGVEIARRNSRLAAWNVLTGEAELEATVLLGVDADRT